MRRLHLNMWKNIIRNTNELGDEIEILWLEDTDEYVLCADTEIFEDGFKDEYEAERRLEQVLRDLNMQLEEKIEDDEYYSERYNNYNDNNLYVDISIMEYEEIVGFYINAYGDEAVEIWSNDETNHYYLSQYIQDRVTRALNILINIRGL